MRQPSGSDQGLCLSLHRPRRARVWVREYVRRHYRLRPGGGREALAGTRCDFQKYSSMVVLDTATAVQRKNRIDLVCTYYDKVRDEQFRASSVMCTSQHSGVCIPHLTQYQTNRTALGALNF